MTARQLLDEYRRLAQSAARHHRFAEHPARLEDALQLLETHPDSTGRYFGS